jgi:hypothetical protein
LLCTQNQPTTYDILMPSIAEMVSVLKENTQKVVRESPMTEEKIPTPDITISPPIRRLSLLSAKTPAAKLAMEKWRNEAMADQAREL